VKAIDLLAPIVLVLSNASLGQSDPSAIAAPHLSTRPLTIDEAVAASLAGNPEIHAAARRLSIAQMKTSTARSLDDSMLMVRDWETPLSQPWNLNQAQLMVGLQQTFPNRQKRETRARLAQDDATVEAANLESLRQEVAAQARKLCADLLRNADEMKLHQRQASLLKEASDAALAQYTIGRVPQADVLRAQTALTRLSEHLIQLEEERDTARAQLNVLMGQRPDEAIEIEGSYTTSAALPALEDLERTAMEHRPELAGLRAQTAKAKNEGTMARLGMKPDFTVALGYMLMPTGSMSRNAYMAEGSMTLPWLNRERHENEAKQADAATELSQSELEARTSAVFLEIRQAQIAVLSAQKRVRLYRDTLLPQAEASFEASAAEYQNNRAEFMSLIDTQNLLLEIQAAYYRASADTGAEIAELERAIGAPIADSTRQDPGRASK
jgi:outer membrane protein TolC